MVSDGVNNVVVYIALHCEGECRVIFVLCFVWGLVILYGFHVSCLFCVRHSLCCALIERTETFKEKSIKTTSKKNCVIKIVNNLHKKRRKGMKYPDKRIIYCQLFLRHCMLKQFCDSDVLFWNIRAGVSENVSWQHLCQPNDQLTLHAKNIKTIRQKVAVAFISHSICNGLNHAGKFVTQ
jgi:hypothetical protein